MDQAGKSNTIPIIVTIVLIILLVFVFIFVKSKQSETAKTDADENINVIEQLEEESTSESITDQAQPINTITQSPSF